MIEGDGLNCFQPIRRQNTEEEKAAEGLRPAPFVPADYRERMAKLRTQLRRQRLTGFIVPRSDEHQSEYVPACSERLAWISGFTGSAGSAILFLDRAALFVDGRYIEQARGEVDASLFEIRHITDEPPADWLVQHLRPADRLGYDPWLHTPAQIEPLENACARVGAQLTAVGRNPLDLVWRDRPAPPLSPITPHPLAFAGIAAAVKCRAICEQLEADQQQAVVLTAPDSIAWLLNIRGGDVPFTPLALAFAILYASGAVDLFIDERKLTVAAIDHLGDTVSVRSPDDFGPLLDRLGESRGTVRVDQHATPVWIIRRLRAAGATLALRPDPCALPKATKNDVELAGIRLAHVRDGVALSRFLAWLDREAPAGTLTEIAAAEQLAAFRAEGMHYRGPSFPTISAASAHGAIVHYRVTPATDRRIEPDSVYLVDSGGQYLDGTTDVTRTIAVGQPTKEVGERFTRVLKGHIALAMARFPRGTSGSQLDALARMSLWRAGLDYDHGTGHGVGAYLGVHEGPQRISKLPNQVALLPGMIISNEPGYYRSGAYGIRIENLVAVVAVDMPENGEQPMYGFETLTLAPIDRRLVVPALLTGEEHNWLDNYHALVCRKLSPLLDAVRLAWLQAATAPIARNDPSIDGTDR